MNLTNWARKTTKMYLMKESKSEPKQFDPSGVAVTMLACPSVLVLGSLPGQQCPGLGAEDRVSGKQHSWGSSSESPQPLKAWFGST